jgi:hypothetical protein
MKAKKYAKTYGKHRLGERVKIRKVKDGWLYDWTVSYGFPTLELCNEFAELNGLKLRPPIVDTIGNITITT